MSNEFDGEGMDEFEDSNEFEPNISSFDEEQEESNNSGIGKNLAICIVVAIIIVVVALLAQNMYSKSKNKYNESNTKVSTSSEKSGEAEKNTYEDDKVIKNNNVETSSVDTSSQWVEVDGTDVIDNIQEIQAMFTVTDVKHFVRVIDQDNIEMRTELRGNVSGLIGTYVLYVPYDKGSNIIVGNSFNVSVKIGSQENRKIIMEIAY